MYKLQTFGRSALFSDEAHIRTTPSAFHLLVFFALHRGEQFSRSHICDTIWPEADDVTAPARLSSTIYRLRQVLPEKGEDFLESGFDGAVGLLKNAPLRCDFDEFETFISTEISKIDSSTTVERVHDIEVRLHSYRGDLMTSCRGRWSEFHREYFRKRYIESLSTLIEFYADRNLLDRAISVAENAAHIDRTRERPQQRLIELYRQNGERALAVRHFQAFAEELRRVLNVEPLPETRALVADLLS